MNKIAIHDAKGSFSDLWIEYCKTNSIYYKIVDCYASDIIQQLEDCYALMWHFSQNSSKDFLFAKQLIYSVEAMGKKVFPDFHTAWHFDDKVGQKYLLEAIGAPLVPSHVFYSKQNALSWAHQTTYPKVFKLRGGAGSQNVRLASSKTEAIRLIKQAFGRGFQVYDPMNSLKERWNKFRLGKANVKDVLKGIIRFAYPPTYAKVKGRETGYIYFQDFIPDLSVDYRLNVINGSCYACQRQVRKGDFRASGSGVINYDHSVIPIEMVQIAFDVSKKLNLQSIAFDFILNNKVPQIIEMSYCFSIDPEDGENGYWTPDLNFHTERFNPQGWMVEEMIK